ncbi:hypothetical protein KUCAC02_037158, partial [Chaenocephalus aceratus]
ALRHEQMFADRFLPDPEAAEALDPSGSSALSWLLSEYLQNVEAARRCKSRAAIFNSRVRRLTRLLVHVDTSRAEAEPLRPPVRTKPVSGPGYRVYQITQSEPVSGPGYRVYHITPSEPVTRVTGFIISPRQNQTSEWTGLQGLSYHPVRTSEWTGLQGLSNHPVRTSEWTGLQGLSNHPVRTKTSEWTGLQGLSNHPVRTSEWTGLQGLSNHPVRTSEWTGLQGLSYHPVRTSDPGYRVYQITRSEPVSGPGYRVYQITQSEPVSGPGYGVYQITRSEPVSGPGYRVYQITQSEPVSGPGYRVYQITQSEPVSGPGYGVYQITRSEPVTRVTGFIKSPRQNHTPLPDFVQRYLSLFLRLRSAMQELFGPQTAFLLALRHGFSSALLSLSVLTAMHVSERFAQFMDQLMEADSSESLQTLQQFLEPLHFLSGLELANTFEHFYRYYLGDRLLARGSVWLEQAVLDQIGGCFPSRFPQQMLQNLKESEELQQEFHLYQLQRLDTHLNTHLDTHLEESQEVHTHLNIHLEEGQQVTVSLTPPPLCVQWTWLGHAELTFSGCTLHVSTLQMFLLLQLNQHQEVQVEALLKQTRLSPPVLLHALKPLISEGGPLTCSRPDEPLQGVLQLDPGFVSRSEGGGVLKLLPRQTYLNVDEDAAATLERKRSFVYCLIVHIMKRERSMHLDNLVFQGSDLTRVSPQVLDSCQKQEVSGRFSCSSADVLSCIDHVISRGCVRRGEENPHIVEFLPDDPASPQRGQAQLGLRREGGPDNRAPNAPPMQDGVLDAILFSMGRTMTQQDVRQLMQRTVQQVSGTLSLDPDRAEHLLIHCRWNVDLLIQRFTDDPDALVLAAGLLTPEPLSPAPRAYEPHPRTDKPCPLLPCVPGPSRPPRARPLPQLSALLLAWPAGRIT